MNVVGALQLLLNCPTEDNISGIVVITWCKAQRFERTMDLEFTEEDCVDRHRISRHEMPTLSTLERTHYNDRRRMTVNGSTVVITLKVD